MIGRPAVPFADVRDYEAKRVSLGLAGHTGSRDVPRRVGYVVAGEEGVAASKFKLRLLSINHPGEGGSAVTLGIVEDDDRQLINGVIDDAACPTQLEQRIGRYLGRRSEVVESRRRIEIRLRGGVAVNVAVTLTRT